MLGQAMKNHPGGALKESVACVSNLLATKVEELQAISFETLEAQDDMKEVMKPVVDAATNAFQE